MSKIKIVGIGSDGISVIDKFLKINSFDVDTIAIDISDFDLNRCDAKIKINIAKGEMLGLDGGSPQRSENFAIKHYEELSNLLRDSEFVITVAFLSSDDGSGVSPVIANIAKNIGARSIAIACMPFYFEGERRNKKALDSLIKLNSAANYVFKIDLNFVVYICNPKTSMTKIFDIIYKFVAEDIQKILNYRLMLS